MHEQQYTLEFEDRGSYLYARLTGNDSFAASLSYWHQIADYGKGKGIQKLLVHENLIGEVSETEMYDVMMDLKDSGLLSVKIAFYDENKAETELNSLGQLVATNRGANIQIFGSLEDAEHWIEQED